MIKIKRHSDLDKSIKEELGWIIESEFGHIPLVKEISWATPHWTVIFYQDREIATFYNIVERTVCIDNKAFLVAGINNVITPNKFRGQGFSTFTLKETENFIFDDLKSSLALLLCADNLIPFYERLDWYKVDCPVYFDQPNGAKIWEANTMLRTKSKMITPKEINLNGLPW
jgi:hypothetical protein